MGWCDVATNVFLMDSYITALKFTVAQASRHLELAMVRS